MADFNPNSPVLLGNEYHPTSIRQFPFDNPWHGLMMRVKSPGVVTESNVDLFLSSIVGRPGLGIELLDAPTITPTNPVTGEISGQVVFPKTDIAVTNWKDQAGAAATFARVDDFGDTSDYITNSADIGLGGTIGANLDVLFRGQDAALAARRIIHVDIIATIEVLGDIPAVVDGLYSLGGTRYTIGQRQFTWVGPGAYTVRLEAYTNPSTGLPWTMAEVNNFITLAGTDSFGIRVNRVYPGVLNANFRLHSLFLFVYHAPENRRGYYYTRSIAPSTTGWLERTLTNASALAANTYYWLHVFNFMAADQANYFTLPVLRDPLLLVQSNPASAGEHRTVYETLCFKSGAVAAVPLDASYVSLSPTVGEMFPIILDRAGTIETTSQPYVERDVTNLFAGTPANFGQEVTTAAAQAYGAVAFVVGWQNLGVRPDAPLTITVQTGAGGLTGAGVTVATATLNINDLANGALQFVKVPFAAAFTAALTTQHFVRLSSNASSGKGWAVVVLDSRSDLVGAGVTAADVQGTTQGGVADSFFTGGVEDDRYDLPLMLVASPTAPAGFTATPVVAL